ncbi:MAG: tetratricopeptide repeat protein, partial [Candidatus Hinthialibacter sp.]
FHTWEGGGKIHDDYVDAYLLRGLTRMKEGKYKEAIDDFQASLLYPDNLEVGKPIVDEKEARALYLIGSAYEKVSDAGKAHDYYQQSAGIQAHSPEILFYQGLALQKLDQPDRAAQIFDRIIAQGKERLTRAEGADFFAKFGERQTPQVRQAIAHYIQALGWIGKGDAQTAADELRQAVELNPNYAWAKMHLSELP